MDRVEPKRLSGLARRLRAGNESNEVTAGTSVDIAERFARSRPIESSLGFDQNPFPPAGSFRKTIDSGNPIAVYFCMLWESCSAEVSCGICERGERIASRPGHAPIIEPSWHRLACRSLPQRRPCCSDERRSDNLQH